MEAERTGLAVAALPQSASPERLLGLTFSSLGGNLGAGLSMVDVAAGATGSPAAASCASSCATLARRAATSAGVPSAGGLTASRDAELTTGETLPRPSGALSQALQKLPLSEAEAGVPPCPGLAALPA